MGYSLQVVEDAININISCVGCQSTARKIDFRIIEVLIAKVKIQDYDGCRDNSHFNVVVHRIRRLLAMVGIYYILRERRKRMEQQKKRSLRIREI